MTDKNASARTIRERLSSVFSGKKRVTIEPVRRVHGSMRHEKRSILRKVSKLERLGEPESNPSLIFFGTGGSGKSTIIKQTKLFIESGREEISSKKSEQKKQSKHDKLEAWTIEVINTLAEEAQYLLQHVKTKMQVELPSSNQKKLNSFDIWDQKVTQFRSSTIHHGDFVPFFKLLKKICELKEVHETLRRSIDQITTGVQDYYGGRPNLIWRFYRSIKALEEEELNTWAPSVEDWVRCSTRTTGINVSNVVDKNGIEIDVIDTGGKRGERRKWRAVYMPLSRSNQKRSIQSGVPSMEVPPAIIVYVVSLANFHLPLYEDQSITQFEDSLCTFQTTVEALTSITQVKTIYLVFNKIDLADQNLLDEKNTVYLKSLGFNPESSEQTYDQFFKWTTEQFIKDVRGVYASSRGEDFIKVRSTNALDIEMSSKVVDMILEDLLENKASFIPQEQGQPVPVENNQI